MKLYINLFYQIDLAQFPLTIEDKKDNQYLDFQGRYVESEFIKNISLEVFSYNRNKAVKDYTSFISALSTMEINNKHIRSYQFNDLPLFWLTQISEKHLHHWMMQAILLKEILTSNSDFFKSYENIYILIPSKLRESQQIIQDFFNFLNIEVQFTILGSSPTRNSYFSLFKTAVKTMFLFFKMKKPELTKDQSNIIFLLAGNITEYTKKFFINISKLDDQNKKDITLIPLYFWNNPKAKINYKVPHLFWKTRPNIYTLLETFYTLFRLLFSIKKIDNKQKIDIDNISYPIALLVKDFENVIINSNSLLIMNCWLTRYNKPLIDKVKFFYEDEFYPSGRNISFCLNNKETYGVQHSMISKNQSVYHISDIEHKSFDDNKEDGLPLPTKFIVWGKYFKFQFLSHNSLPENFVYVAGNTTYIKKSSEKKTINKSNKYFNVLYCLTRLEFFLEEKKILRETLKNIPNVNLIVRFHPLWKIDKKLVSDFFKNMKITFSREENIFSGIDNSNLILTSSHSGVWLDAIIAEKPVIRLTTSYEDDINQSDLIHNVATSKEMENVLQHILNSDKNTKESDLLYLNKDRWEKLLNETNA